VTTLKFEQLRDAGWQVLDCIPDLERSDVTRALGRALVDANGRSLSMLRPTSRAEAKSRSFSAAYGMDAFPLHTDTAFWPTPARYLLMFCTEANETATTLLPKRKTAELFSDACAREAIFYLRTTSGTRFATVTLGEIGDGFRFDPNVMRPANRASAMLVDRILGIDSAEVLKIRWTGSNAVVIDNWRCLHGRAAVGDVSATRVLKRIYLSGGE
jgi:hypothetical protein